MSQREIKLGSHLTIRLHQDGSLDEIVTYDAAGECDFHMEQMDDHLFWMRFYGTKLQPVPKELIVWMGAGPKPGGTIQINPVVEYDEPPTEDDVSPEFRTPDVDVAKQIDYFIKNFGMTRLLRELVANVDQAKQDEQNLFPNRDVEYLSKLSADLQAALQNYETRHEGDD